MTPNKVMKNSDNAEGARDRIHELARLVLRALRLVLADDRNEGLRERAFGEQAAQEVRDLERHQPGVHEGAGAKGLRVNHLAGQAGDTRHQSRHAGYGGALENRSTHPASTRKIKEKRDKPRTIPDSVTLSGQSVDKVGVGQHTTRPQNDPRFPEIPSWRIPSRPKKPPVELKPTAIATWRSVHACARRCARSSTPWLPATRPTPPPPSRTPSRSSTRWSTRTSFIATRPRATRAPCRPASRRCRPK